MLVGGGIYRLVKKQHKVGERNYSPAFCLTSGHLRTVTNYSSGVGL